MFKLTTQKTVTWPVTVQIPQDGGKTQKATFHVRVEVLPSDEFQAIYERGGNDEDLLRRVLVDWDGVADADGHPIPFSEEARDALIRIPYVRVALITAYMEMSQGREARQKN